MTTESRGTTPTAPPTGRCNCGTVVPRDGMRCEACAAEAATEIERDRDTRERLGRLEDAVAAMLPARYRAALLEQIEPAPVRARLTVWPTVQPDERPGLYLTGPVGSGKTHTAAAIVRHTWLRPFRQIVWANVPRLLDQWRDEISRPAPAPLVASSDTEPVGLISKGQTLEQLIDAPLTVLDDLGAERPTEWVRERLYVIINERYENERPLLVTSNLTLDRLAETVGPRVASRLAEMCEQIGLAGRDRRARA